MVFPTVTMAQTNLAVLRWNQISVIKKSTSDAKHRAFVFRLLGTVTGLMTVTIIPMRKIVGRFRAPTTFTSAKTQSVSSKPTFAMEKTTAVTIPTNLMNMRAWHHLSAVPLANGSALTSLLVVST